ncbi:hypothetical protein ACGF5M_00820 [Gemmatimonadota bacterium]
MPPDPLTVTVGAAALERAADLMGKKVLGRWSDYRARRFVDQFVAELGRDLETADPAVLEDRLAKIVEDESKSAALYEAFRHVLLSASREIGPRVLALHMAEVVAGLVDDLEVSDAVMSAASTLLDFEFEEFLGYAVANGITDASFAESLVQVAVIKFDMTDFDSNWRGRGPTGAIPLRSDVGSWAQKLQSVGLLVQDISEEEFDYKEDGERYIDEDGTVRRVHRNIELREGTSHLARLTQLAIRARDSS